MANGDAAAAAGLQVFAATQDRRLGYDNDNIRGDELAAHITTGGHAMSKITGLTDALAAKVDDSEVVVNATANSIPRRSSAGQLTVQPTPTAAAHAASKQYVDLVAGSASSAADTVTSTAYARTVSGGGFYQMWMDNGLRIGRNVSSRRYKDEITPHGINPDAVLALQPVSYHRIGSPPGEVEYGLIAEDVHDAGLTELVVYAAGEDGPIPDGIRYDLLSVALLDVVANLDARLRALESPTPEHHTTTEGDDRA